MKKWFRYFLTLAVATVTLVTETNAYAADEQTSEQNSESALSYVRVYGQQDSIVMLQDGDFYQSALSVQFVVNRTYIRKDNPAYVRLVQDLRDLSRVRPLKLEAMEVRGGASPEGPYQNNVRLAKGRAAALLDSLQCDFEGTNLYFSDKALQVNTVPEDYEYLYRLVDEHHDPDAAAVKAVIDSLRGNDAAIKAALRRMNGGKTWARMLRDLYPSLRAARIVLHFRELTLTEAAGLEAKPIQLTVPQVLQGLKALENTTTETAAQHVRIAEPMLSVKTNVLFDGWVMPTLGFSPILNVMVEYYPHDSRWTGWAEYDFPWWSTDSKHHYFQCLNWSAGARWFFKKNAVRTGHFLTVYGQGNYWDFCFNAEDGYQGEGGGAGVGYGYVWRLGKTSRWKLELEARVGFYMAQYDPYHAGSPYKGKYYYDWEGASADFIRRNHRFTWFGPTFVGVTFSYDLLYRSLNEKTTIKNIFKK